MRDWPNEFIECMYMFNDSLDNWRISWQIDITFISKRFDRKIVSPHICQIETHE